VAEAVDGLIVLDEEGEHLVRVRARARVRNRARARARVSPRDEEGAHRELAARHALLARAKGAGTGTGTGTGRGRERVKGRN